MNEDPLSTPMTLLPHVPEAVVPVSDQPLDINPRWPSRQPLPVTTPLTVNEEDPERPVEEPMGWGDGGEGDDGLGDGLGVEDDEGDSDDDVGCNNNGPASSSPPQLRRPLPHWLQDAFQQKVNESSRRDARGLPPLYADHQTFWFPQKSAYFILERTPHVSPPDLYNPRFFLWDPEALCQILCPNCGRRLQRHQHIPRPRRCIDSHSTFWMVGYRYRCRSCINPRTQKLSVTFRSWDPRILNNIPAHLAAEFPCKLTHRSAISKPLLSWMRSCFYTNMGPKQFSDALRVQHVLAHDELELQYLTFLAPRRLSLDRWWGQKYDSFLPFDNTSPTGRHGFVPSSQWLHDVYAQYIEDHQAEINQHTAMLPADICAIDHSHKVSYSGILY